MPIPLRWAVLGLLLLSTVSTAAPAAPAAGAAVRVRSAEVGLAGRFKLGRWTPVTVVLEGGTELEAAVQAADAEGSPAVFPLSRLPADEGATEFRGLFQLGRLDGDVRLQVRDSSTLVIDRPLSDVVAETEPAGKSDALPRALKLSATLVVTLGRPAGFRELAGRYGSGTDAAQEQPANRTAGKIELVEFARARNLPADPYDYDSVDVVVIAGEYDLGAGRSDAMREWVRRGGHLVVTVGRDVAGFVSRGSGAEKAGAASRMRKPAGADGNPEADATGSPPPRLHLARWFPIPIGGQARLRDLSRLESFTGGGTRIQFYGQVPAARIDPGSAALRDAIVEVSTLEGPLIVRSAYGFGEVTLCGIDLAAAPLAGSRNHEHAVRLAEKLALPDRTRPADSQQAAGRGRLGHSGITDLATQLQATLEHFPQVRRLSNWSVMGLLMLYVVLIGPLDYLLVHRLLKKPRLTWFTFPAVVVGAAVIAGWAGAATNGRRLEINQFDIIDIDAAGAAASGREVQSEPRTVSEESRFHGQWLRGRSWVTLYSPRTARYAIRLRPVDPAGGAANRGRYTDEHLRPALPESPPDDLRLCWCGIPESAFRGMYRQAGLEIGRPRYRFAPAAAGVENLPVDVWSTRALQARWTLRPGGEGPLVEARLVSPGVGQLTGELTHHLAGPLEDWMLVYQNRVFLPAAGGRYARGIPPGVPFSLSEGGVYPRELIGYLTDTALRQGATGEAGRSTLTREQAPYNPLSRDPAALVRTLTFHEAIGGKAYTGLDNHALKDLDLTRLTGRLHRAVLLARVNAPATSILSEQASSGPGEALLEPTSRWTFVRILLPVQQRELRRTADDAQRTKQP